MAAPVWILSVDLQSRTATFQSGMADAARSARSAFADIGNSARSGSGMVSEGTTDVRHSLGLMDNAIRGNHAAAMVDLIRLFQTSSVVMAALPFAGVIGGVLLLSSSVVGLVRHFEELKQKEEQIHDAQTELGTTIQNVFNGLDQKILEAEKQADELSNDHLGALRVQLELIDKQSLEELSKSFETVAKQADVFFTKLKASWYEFGTGSTGAAHALNEFKVQYDSLLAQGETEKASGLLHGTLEQAQKVLQSQKDANSAKGSDYTDTSYMAQLKLRQEKIGYTQKEVQAQEALVQALNAQVEVESKVAELKKQDSKNAGHAEANQESARRSEAARQAVASQLQMGEQSIAAQRAQAAAALEVRRGTLEEQLALDLDFAARERDLKAAANAGEIAALDKAGKDYANQLKALNEKALEIQNDYDSKVAELKAKSATEVYGRDLQKFEQAEREKIEATSRGEAERVAALDAALKDAQARNLQDTQFYRELLTQRVQAVKQEHEQEQKLREEAAKQQIQADQKAAEEKARHAGVLSKPQRAAGTDPSALKEQQDAMNTEYGLKEQALQRDLALYKSEGDLKVQDARRVQDELTALQKEQADRDQEFKLQEQQANRNYWAEYTNTAAQSFLKVAEGRESLARLGITLADQALSKTLEAMVQEIAGNKTLQMSHASTAAAGAYKAMSGIPIVGPELGALAAAAVFAGAMAFEKGGVVPGVGNGDIVPAMLTPGEGIVPKGVMEGLSNVARNGGFERGGSTYHVHVRPTYHVSTISGDGMKAVLEKHSDQISQHVHSTIRRMNR